MSTAKYAGRLMIASIYRKTKKSREEGRYPVIIKDYQRDCIKVYLPTKVIHKLMQEACEIWIHNTESVHYFILK